MTASESTPGYRLSGTFTLRLYTFTGLNEFVPILPLYALLFSDHGLSAAEISTLFMLWSCVALVLELPSGVWADLVSRSRLLALGAVLRALGFALWVIVPSYASFAAGIALWAVCDAMTSGTWEALLYDELSARDAIPVYPRLVGRARAVGLCAAVVAIALATPLYAYGGYLLVGCVTVAACVATAAAALILPHTAAQQHSRADALSGAWSSCLATLRTGLREVHRIPALRHAVLLAAFLQGIWAVEEYLPILFHANGTATADVPFLIMLVTVGKATGGWLVGPLGAIRSGQLAWLLAIGAVLLAAGAAGGQQAGAAAIALCFVILQCTTLLAQVKCQPYVSSETRATVASVARLGGQLTAVILNAAYALGTHYLPPSRLVPMFGVLLVFIAVATARLLPADSDSGLRSSPTHTTTGT